MIVDATLEMVVAPLLQRFRVCGENRPSTLGLFVRVVTVFFSKFGERPSRPRFLVCVSNIIIINPTFFFAFHTQTHLASVTTPLKKIIARSLF